MMVACYAYGDHDNGKLDMMTGRNVLAPQRKEANGVFLLLVINLALFALDHILHLPFIQGLYLNHARPQWFQFFTSMFCHASWEHLSSNVFSLYIFGKLVEEEEGMFGVLASYLVCGLGSSVVSYLLLPHTSYGAAVTSLGASGAVFGLFAISVLVKMRWDWRRMLEVAILGQFVVNQVLSEAASLSVGKKIAGMSVNHIAHLGGAAVGVFLIYLLTRLPADDDTPKLPK
eukprot:jgi/Mesvir1/9832/Mv14235-RA.1